MLGTDGMHLFPPDEEASVAGIGSPTVTSTIRPAGSPTTADTVRATGITVAEIVCVVGTLLGIGVFGGPEVNQTAGGALSADATLIAPATTAFSIWSVIYIGLAVFTLWQWLPGRRSSARHRRAGWLIAASMLLNAAWLLVVRADLLWLSVVVILALVVVLGLIIRVLATTPPQDLGDRIITEGTFGLYLGWVSVAVCANITATLVDAGVEVGPPASEWIAVVVLVVAGAIGVLLALQSGGNLAIGAAMTWGIGWIAVGRLTGEPASTITGTAAIIVAVAIAVFTVTRALQHRPVTA